MTRAGISNHDGETVFDTGHLGVGMLPFVSILMLTHNAPDYVELAVRSVRDRTSEVRYELVVLDNLSEAPTRELVQRLSDEGLIDRLRLMGYNSLFAEGNNLAAALASSQATHYLLLNSDVEILDPSWLAQLLSVHERGITSFGVALDPLRCDGYCLLIDADLYRANPLDTSFQWWWGVTKQQSALLSAGHSVQGYGEHEKWLHHFGGKSGSAWRGASGMDISRDEVDGWFVGRDVVVIDRRPDGTIPGHLPPSRGRQLADRAVRAARRALGRG